VTPVYRPPLSRADLERRAEAHRLPCGGSSGTSDADLLVEFAPQCRPMILARLDSAARRGPHDDLAVGTVESEPAQQKTIVGIGHDPAYGWPPTYYC
jgi:hypothetical protein